MSLATDIEAVTSGQDTQGQRVQQESTMVEENRILKHLYPNYMTTTGTIVARSQSVTLTTNQTITVVMPVFTIPQPTMIEKPTRKMAQEELTKRVKSLEQKLKNIQGSASQKSIAFKDLCMFPGVRLPLGFKTPKFEKYDGHGDPIAHLKRYCKQLRGVEGKEELVMVYFKESLTGFQYNIDIAPDYNSLSNLKKKPTESFREYAIKWREQAARVKLLMDDHELITVFLQAQEPDYFQNMMSAVGKSFSEAIKIGEMVENGLKTGKIISQAVLKAATQAVQIESDNFSDTNEKDEETMMTIRSRRGPRRTSRRYEQPHQVSDDSLEHYYPPQNP
nr:uncharacterized protein LOC104099889 [Nicotiana tomentosiformis]